MTRVYYNDSDAFVCAWLKNLIAAGHLPAGDVDERPIEQVTGSDVAGYDQCHFFAGIGGWPYALQLAGWGDRPVWTGSCPCQPFSAAGQRKAGADARHLWPSWFRLIRECQPERIFGEQVAGAAGLGWLDVVSADLEAEAYTVGAVVLGAHSVGAPHIRQRLWFVADAERNGRRSRRAERAGQRGRITSDGTSVLAHAPDGARLRPERRGDARPDAGGGSTAGELADTGQEQRGPRTSEATSRESAPRWEQAPVHDQPGGAVSLMAHTNGGITSDGDRQRGGEYGFWVQDCVALPCRDGKARPTRAGIFPLAHGIPNRVGTLRGAGNAIVPQVAAAFVSAYMEVSSRDTPPS